MLLRINGKLWIACRECVVGALHCVQKIPQRLGVLDVKQNHVQSRCQMASVQNTAKAFGLEGLSKNLRWHVVWFEIIPIYWASERSTDVAPDAALHRFWRKLLTI